jgi:hypothetical protein
MNEGESIKPEKNSIVVKDGKNNIEEKNQGPGKTEPEKAGNKNIEPPVEKNKVKPSIWKIGLTGGAGISNINQSLSNRAIPPDCIMARHVNVGTGATASSCFFRN